MTSLSLDPPLVLLAVQKESQSYEKFKQAGCYALNILSAEQQELSDRFAFKGPKDFGDLETTMAETGAPILSDVLGWVDCRIVDVLPGGDHDIFIGEIVAGESSELGDPLLYYAGGYGKLATGDS